MVYWSYYRGKSGFSKMKKKIIYSADSNQFTEFFPTYAGTEKLPQAFRDGKWKLVPNLGKRRFIAFT